MPRIELSAYIRLCEPDVDRGLVTWFSLDIREGDDDEVEDRLIGKGRAALIHVGEATNLGEDIYEALDADSGELEALHHVYFDDGWLKEEFTEGFGQDLLYVSHIEIDPAYQGRNIEFAVVRRLCDTVGASCALAVIDYQSVKDIEFWSRMGFEVSTQGQPSGWMHLSQARRRPRVVLDEVTGHFKAVANPPPEAGKKHH